MDFGDIHIMLLPPLFRYHYCLLPTAWLEMGLEGKEKINWERNVGSVLPLNPGKEVMDGVFDDGHLPLREILVTISWILSLPKVLE